MSNSKFYIAVLIASFLDLADIVFFGWLPIAGDILDILGCVFLFPFIGIYAFGGLAELIPVVDFLPMNLAMVAAYKMKLLGGKKDG